VSCVVDAGGVLLMRPLLIHASSAASNAAHRRVIHIDYAACPLDGGCSGRRRTQRRTVSHMMSGGGYMRRIVLVAATSAALLLAADPFTSRQRDFWSFQKIKPQVPPAVKDASWSRTPIDRFVLAKLESKGLHPSPPADKVTLLRRATFDLIGLPPTPEEVAAFVADKSPNAYEKVIDRLLASPPLWRTLGPALAGSRALRGERGLQGR